MLEPTPIFPFLAGGASSPRPESSAEAGPKDEMASCCKEVQMESSCICPVDRTKEGAGMCMALISQRLEKQLKCPAPQGGVQTL